MEQLLYYIGNSEKEKALLKLCGGLKIAARKITARELGVSVGELVSGKASNKKTIPALYVQPELMIFSGFNDKRLDTFLTSYKTAGIEAIDLKAIVTPFNISWSIYEITQELKKERLNFS